MEKFAQETKFALVYTNFNELVSYLLKQTVPNKNLSFSSIKYVM